MDFRSGQKNRLNVVGKKCSSLLTEVQKAGLKKGGMAVLEWLVRLLNLSFDMGVVRDGQNNFEM